MKKIKQLLRKFILELLDSRLEYIANRLNKIEREAKQGEEALKALQKLAEITVERPQLSVRDVVDFKRGEGEIRHPEASYYIVENLHFSTYYMEWYASLMCSTSGERRVDPCSKLEKVGSLGEGMRLNKK